MKGERILKTLPEAIRGILHGIMEKMLAVSTTLKVCFVPKNAKDAPFSRENGFRIRYKSSFWYDIAISGTTVLMKTQARNRQWESGGSSACDLVEPGKFDEWLKMLVGHVKNLVKQSRKAAPKRGGVVNYVSAKWEDILGGVDVECEMVSEKVVLRAEVTNQAYK